MALVLTPTKEADIAAKKAEIAAEEVHTDRAAYIAVVAPLQAELQILVAENKAIIAANAVLTAEYVPPLAEYKVIAQDAIKAACTVHIENKYTPKIQTSAALHVYPFEFEMSVSQFLVNNIKEENRCKDAIDAATTVEEVDAVTPTWSEV